jgi:hypothetical protein
MSPADRTGPGGAAIAIDAGADHADELRNTYFEGDPAKLMGRWPDHHLNVTNWKVGLT